MSGQEEIVLLTKMASDLSHIREKLEESKETQDKHHDRLMQLELHRAYTRGGLYALWMTLGAVIVVKVKQAFGI